MLSIIVAGSWRKLGGNQETFYERLLDDNSSNVLSNHTAMDLLKDLFEHVKARLLVQVPVPVDLSMVVVADAKARIIYELILHQSVIVDLFKDHDFLVAEVGSSDLSIRWMKIQKDITQFLSEQDGSFFNDQLEEHVESLRAVIVTPYSQGPDRGGLVQDFLSTSALDFAFPLLSNAIFSFKGDLKQLLLQGKPLPSTTSLNNGYMDAVKDFRDLMRKFENNSRYKYPDISNRAIRVNKHVRHLRQLDWRIRHNRANGNHQNSQQIRDYKKLRISMKQIYGNNNRIAQARAVNSYFRHDYVRVAAPLKETQLLVKLNSLGKVGTSSLASFSTTTASNMVVTTGASITTNTASTILVNVAVSSVIGK